MGDHEWGTHLAALSVDDLELLFDRKGLSAGQWRDLPWMHCHRPVCEVLQSEQLAR